MSNFRIEFEGLSEVSDRLRQLRDRTGDLKPALKNIGEYMRMRTEENFQNEQTPDGQGWTPLKPKTLQQKRRKKSSINKILQDTGDLRSSLAYQVDDSSVIIGTNIKVSNGYSLGAIHQFGAPKRNIPARPFLGLSRDDVDEVINIIGDHLQN